MKAEKDYEELLRLFNKHKVRYCIIGSYAVAFYARPRYTKDIDILLDRSADNSRRVVQALNEFGFESLSLSEKDFQKKGTIIQLGYEPLRVDLLTGLEGLPFSRAWTNKKRGFFGKQSVPFISLADLILLKKKSKRLHDKIDMELLLASQKKARVAKPRRRASKPSVLT